MTDEEDWVMRPVAQGFCKYESLIDGTLDLADLARMNEYIDVFNENEARIREALEDRRG